MYKQLEFIDDSNKIKQLWEILKNIPNLIVYKQNWNYINNRHTSLCVVLKKDEGNIQKALDYLDMKIDNVTEVDNLGSILFIGDEYYET